MDCRLSLPSQNEFLEPLVRINTDRPDVLGWSETAAWDGVSAYYAM